MHVIISLKNTGCSFNCVMLKQLCNSLKAGDLMCHLINPLFQLKKEEPMGELTCFS